MNKYLEKIAKVVLEPHQEEAIEKMDASGGVVLDHKTGSGKTLTFLSAAERALKQNKDGRVFLAAPSSLKTNIDKEIKKHGLDIDRDRLDVMSYDEAANRADSLRKNKYILAIADEGHKLRNEGTNRSKQLTDIIQGADKRIIATATPAYNKPSDMASVVNLAAGKKVLPTGSEFDNRYIRKVKKQPPLLKRILGAKPEEVQALHNKEELGDTLKTYVHHYDPAENPNVAHKFPSTSERVVEVPMSKEQHQVYSYMENKIPFHIRMKVRMNMPLDKKESSELNAFSSGVRQVSNSTRPYGGKETSPKIQTAAKHLKHYHDTDPNFKGVVYSNYLDAGLKDYSSELKKHGISHEIYHGGLSPKEKDRIKDAYNEGKIKALLVSSSGSEGLDLKGTKLVQVLEPHFNKSKVDQVRGRGARFGSHDDLPEEERHVLTEHYHSVFPKTGFGGIKKHSIDQYLHHNSDTKNDLTNEMRKLYAA